MYYKLYNQEKKIAIPVAILLLVLLSISTILLFTSQNRVSLNDTNLITRLEIGNVTDTTTTIYYSTKTKVKSHIVLWEDQNNDKKDYYDDRDKNGFSTERTNHYISISNLKSKTVYNFTITIDDVIISQINNSPFYFSTGRFIRQPSSDKPAYGKVVDFQGKKLADAIVILKIDEALPIIGRTKNDGSFLLSLCCIYKASTLAPMYFLDNKKALIEIIDNENNSVSLSAAIKNMTPLDKTISLNKEKSTIANNSKDTKTTYLKASNKDNVYDAFDIIYPINNASIPGVKPLLKGFGPINKVVDGVIEPENIIFSARVNDKGIWDYSLDKDLKEGKHTLKASIKDVSDKPITLARTFYIPKSGQAVLGEATPSGTLSPTVSVSTPSASPTQENIPTEPFVLSPTISLEAPGSSYTTIAITSVAVIMLGIGMVLLF